MKRIYDFQCPNGRTFERYIDSEISEVEVKHGPNRKGDIPHSFSSVDKAKKMLNYKPIFFYKKV